MEKKQKSDQSSLKEAVVNDANWYRPVPQAFWDAWLELFRLDDCGVKRSEEEIHDLGKKIEAMPPAKKRELAEAITQSIKESIDGVSRSKESQ